MNTLLNTCRDERHIRVPQGFFRNGWNLFLPKGICSLLLSVITYSSQGFSEQQVLDKVIKEAKKLRYTPFSFQFPATFRSEGDKGCFLKVIDRETNVSRILEKTGVSYPQTTNEEVELLLYLGILFRVRNHEMVCLDVVLEPFPFPEDLLNLTADQKYLIMDSRQQEKKISKNNQVYM